MGLIATIILGLLAGWITGMLVKGHYNVIWDLILGIVGAFVGGWLTSILFGVDMVTGLNITSLIVAVIGAVIVVLAFRLVTRRSLA